MAGGRFPVGVHHTKAPEAERTDLATAVLNIKKLGFQDLNDFDFMDPPPLEAFDKILGTISLGALDSSKHLTKGIIMEEFPLDAMSSKMVVASKKYKCSEEIITISAMVIASKKYKYSVFCRPKNKEDEAERAHQKFLEGNASDRSYKSA